MLSFLRRISTPPSFPTREETQLAQILHYLILLGIVLAASFSLAAAPFAEDLSGPINAAIVSSVFVILFWLLHKKMLKFVSAAIIGTAYVSIVISLVFNGGLRDEAGLVLIAVLALTGFFLGERATVAIGLITGGVLVGLYMAEHLSWISETEHFVPVGLDELLIALIAVGVTTIILRQLVGKLISSNRQIQQQANRMQEKNHAIQKAHLLLAEQTQQLGMALAELRAAQTELVTAKDQAEAANKSKSDFLSRMSHDLRSPLTSMIEFSDTLIKYPDFPEEERIEWLGHIQRNGKYLLGMIDDLLDLSRIEAQKLELYPEPFLLLSCLTDLTAMMQMKATEKGIQMLAQFDERLPLIWNADEQRLRQVLINLLENAIKFTPQGSVMLKVGMETAVLPSAYPTIRFEVIDTGIGIAADDLARILIPFEQADERNQRGQGVGLGLAICTQLVEMMGGKLMVESQINKGSRFWFELTDQSH